MVNNFEQIRELLTFPNENSFYFLEIIKRRKENPEMVRHAKTVKDYYIYSLKEFDELKDRVIEVCDAENARAYFRLNVRDAKKTALQFNKRLADLLVSENYKAIKNLYASVVGEFHHDLNKKWLIDVDFDENRNLPNNYASMVARILSLTECKGILAQVPTKNGLHLITVPFRMDIFKADFPNVDVHKDNPTILYIP